MNIDEAIELAERKGIRITDVGKADILILRRLFMRYRFNPDYDLTSGPYYDYLVNEALKSPEWPMA